MRYHNAITVSIKLEATDSNSPCSSRESILTSGVFSHRFAPSVSVFILNLASALVADDRRFCTGGDATHRETLCECLSYLIV